MASGPVIEVHIGDIVKIEADAIVNAANERLTPGGGVCGAIFRAAGEDLMGECEALDGCPTGEARITGGHNLPARWIVHAVGPVWQGGGEGEAELLAGCYSNALAIASDYRMNSIAFPAISTGIFGYPPEKAAKVAVAACREHMKTHEFPRRILLVAFDAKQAEPLKAALTAS